MSQSIYVAISKETGEVLSGAKGQYAFGTPEKLNRSMVHVLRAPEGQKVKDLYEIHELTRDAVLGRSKKDSSFDLVIYKETLSVFNEDSPQAVAHFSEEDIFTVASLMELAFRAGAQGYGFTFEVIEEEDNETI